MLSLRKVPAPLSGHEPFYLIVTWFQSGRIRPASGSWGSLAALPFCWGLKYLGGNILLGLFIVVAVFAALKAIKAYAEHAAHPDPSEVVIDEVIGMAILWLAIPLHSYALIVIGFVLFRLFDSVKLGPVGWCDKNIKGARGVIIDDMVAGLFAMICVLILVQVLY